MTAWIPPRIRRILVVAVAIITGVTINIGWEQLTLLFLVLLLVAYDSYHTGRETAIPEVGDEE